MRTSLMSVLVLAGAVSAGAALAGDDMSGLYKRPNGNLVMVASCGKGYCVTSQTVPYKGRKVGEFSPAGDGVFKGTLTDLKNGKEYRGKASFDGKTLTVAGCVLGGIICKSESWYRQ